MYCNKCGKFNPEEAKFCEGCGNRITIYSDVRTDARVFGESEALYFSDKKKNSKILLGAIAIFTCIALFFVTLLGVNRVIGGNNTPEKPIQYYVEGVGQRDIDIMMKAFPSQVKKIVKDNPLVKNTMKKTLDSVYEKYGYGNATYEIINKTHCTKRQIEDYEIQLNKELVSSFSQLGIDIDYIKVQDAYKYEVEFTYSGSKDNDIETLDIVIYKIKGKWYIFGM